MFASRSFCLEIIQHNLLLCRCFSQEVIFDCNALYPPVKHMIRCHCDYLFVITKYIHGHFMYLSHVFKYSSESYCLRTQTCCCTYCPLMTTPLSLVSWMPTRKFQILAWRSSPNCFFISFTDPAWSLSVGFAEYAELFAMNVSKYSLCYSGVNLVWVLHEPW